MGHRIMVVKLLQMYRDGGMVAWVHNRSGSKKTALDYAVLNGHMEIVRLLAPIQMPSSEIHNRTSQSPTESDKQYLGSALIASAKAQPFSLEMSEYLIAEGADVNFIREDYCETVTPLYCAAGANLELVQFLLALGADPNLDRRRIPLFNASNADIAQALLDAGANLHAEDDCGRNALEANIMDPNTTVTDLVMFRFRFFVERGVDLNHADEFGQTPLHLACGIPYRKASKISQGKAWVELLLQFGAATVEKTDEDGNTPVDIAMNFNRTEIVKILSPLVQDPDLKLRVAAWWKRKLDEEVEGPGPDTLI
ncbi:ankyrin repeat-containing domain protein [Mycena galopus ATCC 62051]|nr:ankyrin repeat-containing domain protein [Mycena galopus ATCC 62051]